MFVLELVETKIHQEESSSIIYNIIYTISFSSEKFSSLQIQALEATTNTRSEICSVSNFQRLAMAQIF
jgi:hypothetical protein